jgi:hypothetical protein
MLTFFNEVLQATVNKRIALVLDSDSLGHSLKTVSVDKGVGVDFDILTVHFSKLLLMVYIQRNW